MPLKSISHVEKLSRVGVYADPDNRTHIPEKLAQNRENIEILLAGEVFYPDGKGKNQRFGRGTIFWHRSGEFDIFNNTVSTSRYRCAVFTFEVNSFNRPVPSIGQWQDPGSLENFIYEASKLFLSPQTDNEFLTIWCYGTLLRQFITTDFCAGETLPTILQQALLHINIRMPEAVSIKELTTVIQCSAAQLHRLFMQHLKITPGEYILRRRLVHAANLLLSGLAIQRIADECGFQTIPGFYSAFRKVYNCTPGEYREHAAFRKRQMQDSSK